MLAAGSGPVGTSSALGLPSRRLSRAIRIIRNTCPVGLTSTAEGVTGTTIRSAIIIAEAITGTITGGRSMISASTGLASSAARASHRPPPVRLIGGAASTRIGNRPLCPHSQALPCGSTSSRTTSSPRVARAQARFTAIVVLPVPPLRLPLAMIWPILRA